MSHPHSRSARLTTAAAICVWVALPILMSCAESRSASFDDARIAEDVKGALSADHMDAVSVDVRNGRVTLVGILATQEEKLQAQRDAERVDGVVSVKNEVEVRKP